MSAPADPKETGAGNAGAHSEPGLQIVVALCAVLRVARAYDAHNQAYRSQLTKFAAVLAPLFARASDVVLAVVDNDLYLNGTRIPVNAFSFRFQRTVIECFQRAQIAGMRVSEVADPAELGQFFEFLLADDGPRGMDFVATCRNAGLAHTQAALYAAGERREPGVGAPATGGPSSGSGDTAAGGTLPGAPPLPGLGVAGDPSAQNHMAEALKGAQSILAPNAYRSGVELRHAKRVVQPLVDATKSSEPLLVGLSVLHHHERDVYGHVVSVATVALAIGQSIGLDRTTLADLGVAALYHDVGMSVIETQLHNSAESLSKSERTLLELHTLEGAKRLAATTTLNRTSLRSMRVALEHHVLAGGVGYPTMPPGWRPSLLSRIVGIADCYVSLIGRPTGDGTRTTPYVALGMMLGPLQNRFDAPLLRSLVEAVGFYPPGQLVELTDGSLALAMAVNPADLARPHVLVLTDQAGTPLAVEKRPMLHPLSQPLGVRRPLGTEALPPGVSLPDRPPLERAA